MKRMKRIAIQGEYGSFHDIAAHLYFANEQIQLTCCATFEDVFAEVKSDSAAIAMLAIENTIAGSLLHNYDLLRQSGTMVVGEQRLHIQHCICCLPDDDWSTIKEVHSHPVALMQCRSFLSNHPNIKAVEERIRHLPYSPLSMSEEGSLSKVLTILSFYDINLTKIQSLPIIGHEWEYLFYVDLTFDNFTRYRQAIDAITPLVKSIKILGEYKEN